MARQRRGASFMPTPLSFNNQTMMDYLSTDIDLKARNLRGAKNYGEDVCQCSRADCRLDAASCCFSSSGNTQWFERWCLFSWFHQAGLTSEKKKGKKALAPFGSFDAWMCSMLVDQCLKVSTVLCNLFLLLLFGPIQTSH